MKKLRLSDFYHNRVTVKLSNEQILRLNKVCSDRGISYSKYIRDIIDNIKEVNKDLVIEDFLL